MSSNSNLANLGFHHLRQTDYPAKRITNPDFRSASTLQSGSFVTNFEDADGTTMPSTGTSSASSAASTEASGICALSTVGSGLSGEASRGLTSG
jgi:hypothetical protein